jgi:hypothetical protein
MIEDAERANPEQRRSRREMEGMNNLFRRNVPHDPAEKAGMASKGEL